MKRILYFTCLLLLYPNSTFGADSDENDRYRVVVGASLNKQLRPSLAKVKELSETPIAYDSLSAYYQRAIREFSKIYGDIYINENFTSILKPYQGTRSLTSFDVSYIPFAPLVPEATYELHSLAFHKITVVSGDRAVQGLRITSELPRKGFLAQKLSDIPLSIEMAYISSLNARVLGFTHARLIPELSLRIEPANKFSYNGLRDWSEHNRIRPEDQLSKPIELTNHAHSSANRYDISAHPDFALKGTFTGESPITLTFFLWRSPSFYFLKTEPKPGVPPDFVFQFVIFRREVPLQLLH